jgi:two-component system chemotaxis response regulator CheB
MGPDRRTRVLIVDDSAVMRSLLRGVVTADARLEVAGTATDGAAALQSAATLKPDVMLLDVEMPVMDGLTTLKRLRAQGHKLPVIMCSSLTQRGARVTIEALAGGAADYVTKPAGQESREAAARTLSQELLPKIHALTRRDETRTPAAVLPWPKVAATAGTVPAVVAIGVSTGGPEALDKLLPALPSDFGLPVLVVQHMPELFTRLLAERLDQNCRLRVSEAKDGETLAAGHIYIARGDWHLEAHGTPQAPRLRLTQGPLENHCRPAADVMFRSLAGVYGGAVLAVVLTGMGSDGLAGCRILRGAGATVLVQDAATSAVWGMPGAVAAAGLAHKVLPLGEVAPEILRIAARGREAREPREAAVQS